MLSKCWFTFVEVTGFGCLCPLRKLSGVFLLFTVLHTLITILIGRKIHQRAENNLNYPSFGLLT